MTNRMSHTRFRLVPKSMTLEDLQRALRTLFENTCVFGAHHKNLNEDLHYQQRRCSAMTLVSGNIRFISISGFPGEGASNDSGAIENGNFQ